jgi:hypothetical protein
MRLRDIVVALGIAICMTGCTKSNIVNKETVEESMNQPDFQIYFNVDIDPDQLYEDVCDIMLDEDDYPMAEDLDVEINLDEEYVNVVLVVKDGTSGEDASEFAMAALKTINDEVAGQDFSYGESDEYSFGGLYQDNVINLKLYNASEYENGGACRYEITIPEDTYMTFDIE